ncbi:MAG: site-specific tyrosine recombinase/integron integrase [Bacteroidota bacterium]
MQKTSITLESKFHRGSRQILVRYWHNPTINDLVRSMGGKYSNTYSCWYVKFSEENLLYLRQQLVDFNVLFVNGEVEQKKQDKLTGKKRIASGATSYISQLNKTKEQEIKLYEQYLRGQRYSKSTIESYLTFVRSFLGYYSNKESAYITIRDIHKYNYDVIVKNRYSISYQRQFIGAIKLFFSYVTHCTFDTDELERPRKEKKLPTVLSKGEIRQVLVGTKNLKHKTILSTIYSCGLRISEALNLRIGDVDPDRMQIHIKGAKGKKDRYVKIAKANYMVIKSYLNEYTPRYYLFEGPDNNRYSSSSVRQVLKRACKKAGIRKYVTPHTLRHSYATHMLELGIDLRYVQTFLGHKKPETTMIYTHVSSEKVDNMANPLDELFREELIGLSDKHNRNSSKPTLIPKSDWGY